MAIVPPHTHPRHEHSQYADAVAVAGHAAASDPHAAYLKAADVLAGANVTVTDNGNGTVSIASGAGSGTIIAEPGIIEFDDPAYDGANDDAILDNIIAAFSGATYKPTIRLRAGRTDFAISHQVYTGFALIGAGGPVAVEQVRTGTPYASYVKVSLTGTAGTRFLFTLPAGATHRVTIQGIAFEGNSSSSFIGSTVGGVLWTSTLRDLTFSAFYSVLGSRTYKLLNTAILCDGYWNINNSYDTAVVVGGSDSIFWVGSNFLIDSPTSLNGSILYHMWFDYQEKTVVGGAFCTAEQEPAAVRVTGGSTTDGLIFFGMRFEGRNAGQPSYGSVVRVEGGECLFWGCWIAYGFANSALSGRSSEGGVVTVLGGNVSFDQCLFGASTGNNTEASPYIYASGASTKVRIRNQRKNEYTPYVKAVSGAVINTDSTVVPVAGTSLAADDWRYWVGTQAAYDAITTKDACTMYAITG